jgi:hypothetical protein
MFSRSFFVETGSSQTGQAIKVQWRDNMAFAEPPRIIPYDRRDYTKLEAHLDLKRFNPAAKFTPDFIGLLKRRAWDIAALHNVQVFFNGKPVRFDNLR